jgi:nicotinamide riboside transporter PnuC
MGIKGMIVVLVGLLVVSVAARAETWTLAGMANNRRRRGCFMLWLASNGISAAIHAQIGVWSLFARDVVFFFLAAEGWWLWGRERNAP